MEKNKTTGFKFKNCSNISIEDSLSAGNDVAIQAENTKDLNIKDFLILGKAKTMKESPWYKDLKFIIPIIVTIVIGVAAIYATWLWH